MPLMDMKNSTFNDLQIKVDLPNRKGDPKEKKAVDIEAVIKRRLNRDIKDNQMSLHKVHLASLFANGFLTNRVLSDGYLMGLALKLLPNKTCYPSGPTSVKYFEAISKWYKSAITLKGKAMVLTKHNLKKKPPLKLSLAIQMTYKHAVCKRDYILIFIIILRAMGIECRLVMNLQPLSMKPPQTDLHKIVMKRSSTEKSNKAETKSKKSKLNEDYDSDLSEDSIKKNRKTPHPSKGTKSITSSRKSTTSSRKSITNTKEPVSKASTSKTATKTKATATKSDPKATKKTVSKETKKEPSKKVVKEKEQPKQTRPRRNTATSTSSATSSLGVTTRRGASRSPTPNSKVEGAKTTRKKPTTAAEKKVEEKPKREPPKRQRLRKNTSTSTSSTTSLSVPTTTRGASRSPSPNLKVDDNSKTKKTSTTTKALEKKLTVPATKRKSPSPLKISPKFLKKDESPEVKPRTTGGKKKTEAESKAPKKIEKNIPKIKVSSTSLFSSKAIASEKPSTSKAAATKTAKPKAKATTSRSKKMEQVDGAMDYFSSSDDEMCQLDGADDSLKLKPPNLKKLNKRRIFNPIDSDDDFVKTPPKKPKVAPKIGSVDRRVFSSDDGTSPALESSTTKCDFWVEVFCEEEEMWLPIDLLKGKVNQVDSIQKQLTSPVNYVYGWNSDQTIKDVTARYSKDWSNVVRKHRVEPVWLDELLEGKITKPTPRDKREDALMKKFHLEKALPTAVSDYKNHPLYALQRHLLKFESIYPPNAPTLGFVRGEPVYARECVHTLHSREIWLKSARTVKLGEKPYKIVKARPKWNKVCKLSLEHEIL